MELRRQISVLRSWIWLLLASIVLAAGAAYLVSINLPKVYEGRVTLIVGQSTQATNPDLNQLLASQRLSQTYATGEWPILVHVVTSNRSDDGQTKRWFVEYETGPYGQVIDQSDEPA